MKIQITLGDITQQDTIAIVNAANRSLLGGGGVDGAIHRAAGPLLLAYTRTLNGCEIGEAKISPGFNLKAKYVIHTVGPIWRGGTSGEDELLANCYKNSLKLAMENGIKSISFPCISTGIYGYPPDKACVVAIREAVEFLKTDTVIEQVLFVCFDKVTFDLYMKHLQH